MSLATGCEWQLGDYVTARDRRSEIAAITLAPPPPLPAHGSQTVKVDSISRRFYRFSHKIESTLLVGGIIPL